jgi:hypothetical protein
MKKVKLALAALMLAFAFAGCMDNNGGKGSETTAEIAAKGTVNITVVGVDKKPVKGVRVSIDSKAGTTDADGILSLKDIDISGASAANPVNYNIVATKENFANLIGIATFTQDTIVDDDGKSIELNPTTSAEVTTGEGKVLVGDFIVSFKNGTANVLLTMVEMVTLKGKLELPVGETFDAGSVRVIPTITNLMTEVPKSDYNFEITNSTVTAGTRTVEYSIKDVPIVNIGAGVMILNVYNAGNTNDAAPDYYYTNSTAINLTDKALTRAQAGCNMGTFKLEPYYNLTGIVYKEIAKTTPVGRGAQVNMTTNTPGSFDGNSVLTDENGRYTFHKLKSATYYPVLSTFDLNGDGRMENQEGRAFDPVVMGAKKNNPASAANTITRDLWFNETFAYTVKGTAYLQSTTNTMPGIVVELLDNNNALIATTKTAADGTYQFTGVVYKNVKVSTPGIDTDGDGILNFNSVAATSVVNSGLGAAVCEKDLILLVNANEYSVKIAKTNVGDTNAGGAVTVKPYTKSTDTIIVTFVNPIATEYRTGGATPAVFTLAETLVPATTVSTTVTWSADGRTATITAATTLDKTKAYNLTATAFAAVDAKKYGIGKTAMEQITGINFIQD